MTSPSPNIPPSSTKDIKILSSLWPFLKPYKIYMLWALISLIAAAFMVLTLGTVLRVIIDNGLATKNTDFLNHGLFFLLICVLILAFASYSRFYAVSWLGEKVINNIQIKIFHHMIQLDSEYFERQKIGDILSRMTNDCSLLQGLIGSSVSVSLRNMLTMIGSFIMLLIINIKLTSFVFLIIPFVVIPVSFLGKKVRQLSKESQKKISALSSFSEESLNAIQTIQAYCQGKETSHRFDRLIDHSFQTALRYIRTRAIMITVVISLIFGAISTLFWAGGQAVLNGQMTPGELSSFIFYAVLMAGSVGSLSEVMTNLQSAAGAMDRLFELFHTLPKISRPQNPITLPKKLKGHMQFNHVSFEYPSRKGQPCLENFNLSIPPKKTLALVGPSGSGKTTIFRLLMRFYDTQSGSILLDGINIKDLDPDQMRKHFGWVSQDTTIFSANVRDNITFSNPNATQQELEQACELANAMEFINDLPNGFDSFLGEKGIRLSGGQRQRLSLARAVIKKPQILLLDEATSSLDSQSEQWIQQSLKKISKERTTLIIAHRLSTVMDADQIIVLDQGKIVGQGNHHELLKSNNLYQELAKKQFQPN